MTASKKILGYVNDRLYTDVHSKQIYEENGKIYAVEVEKIRACEPEFIEGGFVAHCTNQYAVWSGQEVKEIGVPFEVDIKDGMVVEYGHAVFEKFQFLGEKMTDEFLNGIKKEYAEEGVNVDVEYNGHSVLVYKLTKTGKRRNKTYKIGRLEDRCDYFYDYNF